MSKRFIAPRYLKATYESRARANRESNRARQPRRVNPIQPTVPPHIRAGIADFIQQSTVRRLPNPNYITPMPIELVKINTPFKEKELENDGELLSSRFNSATECWNVQAEYCVETLKKMVKICPYLFFSVEIDRMMKLRWENIQYDKEVEEIELKCIEEMHYWFPSNRRERAAVIYFIKSMLKKLNGIILSDISSFNIFERNFIGINNAYQFEDMKKDISEVIECMLDINLSLNIPPYFTSTLCDWIINNKKLKSPLFKILAVGLASIDIDRDSLKKARDNLYEIKQEEKEEKCTPNNEETTELSEIVKEPDFMDELDLSADEEQRKAFDALFFASQKN